MPTVRTSGAEIYYELHGSGPALVFAHGRGGNAASWWQQVPHFAKRYQVVVFDHRAFGRSRCDSGAFDRARFSDDLLAILDAERIEQAAIVCQSMGGWTGLRTALRHPQRVSCLVLSNTPAGIDTPQVAHALQQTRQQFATRGVGRAAVADDFATRAPERAYLYAHIGGLNVNLPDDLYSSDDAVAPGELASMHTPTLFITSENDPLFPPRLIESLSGLVPAARFAELPQAGHSPYFETPDAFNTLVGDFLAEHIG